MKALTGIKRRICSNGLYRELELRNTHREFGQHNRPNLYYPFYVSKNGNIYFENSSGREAITPDWDDGFNGCWTWGLEKSKAEKEMLVAKKVRGFWKIYRKAYASSPGEQPMKQLKSIWDNKKYHTEKGQAVFNKLFDTKEKIFQSPKSVDLLVDALLMSHDSDAIALDFFAGSCTTAHAVLDLNKEDNGSRKFILVQLPEPCEENSEAFKAGYKNIADIGKERIRRVIKKIEKEQDGKLDFGEPKHDLGFKVFKLDKSNFKIWDGTVANKPIQEQLKLAIDHIDPNSREEDILYEILLKSGFELTTSVEELTLEGKKVYSVAEGALLICLEKNLTKNLIRAIAEKEPHRVVCLDSGFKGNDQLKTNAVQIMKSFKVESFRTV